MSVNQIWESKTYYQTIASLEDFSHPGFQKAIELCRRSESILDVGCGDGSKLERLGSQATKKTGCEVSRMAITMATNIKYRRLPFSPLPTIFLKQLQIFLFLNIPKTRKA